VEVEEVEEAGEEKYTFGDPRGIRSSSPSSTRIVLGGGVRDSFRGEDFLEGGRGRGLTLWLEANIGVRLCSLLFGVTRPTASMSPTSSRPSAAPRGLSGIPFAPFVEGPGPNTRCFFTGVTKLMGTSRPNGGGEVGRVVGGAEVTVFRRFAGGRAPFSIQPAGSSPVVSGESARKRLFAAARCASWDSGVVSPSRGILLRGEKGGRASTEMDGSSNTPGRFFGVEVTACENDGGINA